MKRLLSLFTLSLLLSALCVGATQAQSRSERLKPKWVTSQLPEPETDTYFFVSAHGVGRSLEAANQSAFINLSKRLEDEHGMVINSQFKQVTKNTTTTDGSKGSRESEMVVVAEERGKEIKIGCRIIDEWWDYHNGSYETYVLYAVSRGSVGGSYADNIVVTANYPEALLLSVVPSVGQFYKGDAVKGSIILATEIAAIGGIIICENTRASYIKKMYEQPKHAIEYNSLADTWETGRNISIAAAASIYAYSLIDAFLTKGAKRVKVSKRGTSYNVAPYTANNSVGVAMSVTF